MFLSKLFQYKLLHSHFTYHLHLLLLLFFVCVLNICLFHFKSFYIIYLCFFFWFCIQPIVCISCSVIVEGKEKKDKSNGVYWMLKWEFFFAPDFAMFTRCKCVVRERFSRSWTLVSSDRDSKLFWFVCRLDINIKARLLYFVCQAIFTFYKLHCDLFFRDGGEGVATFNVSILTVVCCIAPIFKEKYRSLKC